MRFILEMDYSPVNRVFSWLSVKNLLPLTSSWSLDVIVQSLSHIQLFWPHGLQHARFPCPSLSPGIYTNSCPLSQWCHPTISSSVAPSPPVLSLSQLQSLFQGLLFTSTDASASASVLPMNIQSWFFLRIDWFDFLAVQVTLKSLLQHHNSKTSILWHSALFMIQLSHPYMTTGKTIALTRWTFVGKVMSLLFNMLSRLVITFLPKSIFYFHGCSHHLQWFWTQENKICYCFHFFPIYLPWSDGTRCHHLT